MHGPTSRSRGAWRWTRMTAVLRLRPIAAGPPPHARERPGVAGTCRPLRTHVPAEGPSPQSFYDARGPRLFNEITRLPRCYPTFREREGLAARAAEIAALTGADTLVELGSGTSDKTRLLLDGLRNAGILRRCVRSVRRLLRGRLRPSTAVLHVLSRELGADATWALRPGRGVGRRAGAAAGLRLDRWWTDAEGDYAVSPSSPV